MFVPIYDTLEGRNALKTIFLSIHNTIRMFVVDADFSIIQEYFNSWYAINGVLAKVFEAYAVVMFVVAPVMTAGFVLSFVKDAWAHILSFIRFSKTIIYMSELNPQSISLARDIRASKKYRKSMIVFFEVFDEHGEEYHELISRAQRLGAICFRKDISSAGIRPVLFFKRKKLRKFFFIGMNEEENIKQAINLIDRCRTELHPESVAEFYVFSTASDSEALLDAVNKERPLGKAQKSFKVRRIDVTKNLAINTMQDYCKILPTSDRINSQSVAKRPFFKAIKRQGNKKIRLFTKSKKLIRWKKICRVAKLRKELKTQKLYASSLSSIKQYSLRASSVEAKSQMKDVRVLIVGAGAFGTELLKTICWTSQLPNCNPIVHIIDKEQNTKQKFKSQFPELLEYSGKFREGDARYTIEIHSGIDVNGSDFEDKIKEIGKVDIAFAALGDDELNVKAAMDMRKWFGRIEANGGAKVPKICAVVYSTRKTETFNYSGGLKCQGGQEYGIDFIGDIKSVYSLRNVENSALEKGAEPYHMFWATNGFAEKKTWLRRLQNANPETSYVNAQNCARLLIERTYELLDLNDKEKVSAQIEALKENASQMIESIKTRLRTEREDEVFAEVDEKLCAQIDAIVLNTNISEYGKYIINSAKKWLRETTDSIVTSARLEKAKKDVEDAKVQIETDKQNYSCYEYYRRASISRAVHNQMLKNLGYVMTGNEKKVLEHARWNTFMRAEGYVYTDKKPKAKNIDKLHTDLKPYSKLSRLVQSKDF